MVGTDNGGGGGGAVASAEISVSSDMVTALSTAVAFCLINLIPSILGAARRDQDAARENAPSEGLQRSSCIYHSSQNIGKLEFNPFEVNRI